jgi:galactose mutarotase-like enzyme
MNEMLKTSEVKKEFIIETLKGPNDSEISYCPEIGGIITSIKFEDIEILRKDPKNFEGGKTRGGIQIMFPNAGPLDKPLEGLTEILEQHGFARSSQWEDDKTSPSELIEVLKGEKTDSAHVKPSDKNFNAYPYEYVLKMISKFRDDGSLLLIQEVKNNSKVDMPISMGMHPYFRIPKGKKDKAEIDFGGDQEINKRIKDDYNNWSNDKAMIVENPKCRNNKEGEDNVLKIKIKIPETGTIEMDVFEEYESIWIWSKEREENDDDDFICIEPVMRKPKGLTSERRGIVKPGEAFQGRVGLNFEKEPSSEIDANNQS